MITGDEMGASELVNVVNLDWRGEGGRKGLFTAYVRIRGAMHV